MDLILLSWRFSENGWSVIVCATCFSVYIFVIACIHVINISRKRLPPLLVLIRFIPDFFCSFFYPLCVMLLILFVANKRSSGFPTGVTGQYWQLMNHPDPKVIADWALLSANKFGRLFQGVEGRTKSLTNTCFFIHRHKVPTVRFKDVTYGKFECSVCLQKEEENWARLVLGGNRTSYTNKVGTPTAKMLLIKIMPNSVVSTDATKFMTINISDFYLNTPLKRFEYVKLKMTDVPDKIKAKYNLHDKAIDGHVYVKVRKTIYGLLQSDLFSNEFLKERLERHEYYQSKLVPVLWKHNTRSIQFTLVVDDFGVKYQRKQDVEHLMAALRENYCIKDDWAGGKYIGITLNWDYVHRQVHLSMSGYNKVALKQFHHEKPLKRQDSPHASTPITYGAKQQFSPDRNSFPLLNKKEQRLIQQICRKFLFASRATDGMGLVPLSSIAFQ